MSEPRDSADIFKPGKHYEDLASLSVDPLTVVIIICCVPVVGYLAFILYQYCSGHDRGRMSFLEEVFKKTIHFI